MTINEEDNDRTIELGAGDVFSVRLNENATTGYRWTVENAGGLETVADRFERGGGEIGTGGVRVLQFRSPGSGRHELHLKNRREWEGDSSVLERFNVTIVVK